MTSLKKTATRREQVLGILVTIAIFIVFFRVFYGPKRLEIVQLRTQVQNLRLEKEALEKFTHALLERLPQMAETARGPFGEKMKILRGERKPLVGNVSDLFTLITDGLFLKGLKVREMSELSLQSIAGFRQSGFKLKLDGNFQNMVRYLSRLQDIPALLTVDGISVNSAVPKGARVQIDLEGNLYGFES